jgi:hypothetical protein
VTLELTAFRAETHGFRFANSFSTVVTPSIPLVSTVGPLDGLCGGMTFAALDYFAAGLPVPTHTSADFAASGGVPPDGSALWEAILRRHLNSVGLEASGVGVPLAVGPLQLSLVPGDPYNPVRFATLNFADPAQRRATLVTEIAALTPLITSGRPAALFLVKQGSIQDSHQVVATGYDDGVSPVEIYLYDCRYPTVSCTLRVDTAAGTCQLDAPGQPVEVWDVFFVAHHSPVTPSYQDLVLTTTITASLVPFPGSRRFNVQFAATNQGQAQAHLTELWPVVDPDPGPVPTQPIGVLPVAGLAFYAFDIDFPATLAGVEVTMQAVAGDRAAGVVTPLPTAPGATNLVTVTVPLEF